MSWTHRQAAACCQELGDIETILRDSETGKLLVATVTIDGVRWHIAPSTTMVVAAIASDEILGPITQNDLSVEAVLKPIIDNADRRMFTSTSRGALERWCANAAWGMLVLQPQTDARIPAERRRLIAARIPVERRRLEALVAALRVPIQDGEGLESLWTIGPHPTIPTAVVIAASTVRGAAYGVLQGLAPNATIPPVELEL